MVTLTFKMSALGTVSLELAEPETLATLIGRCSAADIDPGGCIAIRNGTVIRPETMIFDGDEITILPAISGG